MILVQSKINWEKVVDAILDFFFGKYWDLRS